MKRREGGVMRIQVIDLSTNKPLISKQIQIQVKGNNQELLTLSTDTSGFFHLDDKFRGQPITASANGAIGTVTALEGAKVMVKATAEEKLK